MIKLVRLRILVSYRLNLLTTKMADHLCKPLIRHHGVHF